MQSLELRNETLVEIATFLVRRWSQKENVLVEFSDKMETKTRLVENKVINGKNKRIYLENLGVLGQDITISEAKAILHKKYPARIWVSCHRP